MVQLLWFLLLVAYAVYISGQPVIDPINQKELFYEKISMSDLRTNVVLQKTVTLSMNASLLIFSFGFADLIKRKGALMYNFFTVTILRFVSIYFVISVFIAAYFYPGGNIHDSLQVGYSFTHNFLK